MSSSRKESERTKLIQEKCQSLLTLMLRDEDNKYCVDCDAKGPRWASWNLGVFLCIRCAGIHRNLGVHISRVKSVNLDSWTPEQVVSLQQMSNSRARAVYEAQMPDGFRRPQTDSALESFIRAKYEQKKYVAREWKQPSPVKVNWDKEIDEELEKQKRKKKGLSTTTSTSNGRVTETTKSNASYKSVPIPAPLPKPTANSNSPKISSRNASNSTTTTITTTLETNKTETKSYSSDLLGLSTPVNGPPDSNVSAENDVFGYFMSETPVVSNVQTSAVPPAANNPVKNGAPPSSLAQQEQDFFNQVPSDKDKAKMTKDSILALYGAAPTINRMPQQSPNNHFMAPGMPTQLNNDFANLSTQFQQQSPFPGQLTNNANNFAQFGMMQQGQQTMNFQQPMNNTIQGIGGNQGIGGFPNLVQQTNQSSFIQPNANVNLAFSTIQTQKSNANVTSANQQFGNLNLGNVWQ